MAPRCAGTRFTRISVPMLHRLCRFLAVLLAGAAFALAGADTCPAASRIPSRNSTSPEQLKHSDPGYRQHLENRSLLGSSRDLARIVSGSQIMWHAPATDPAPESLLSAASTWLSVHPRPLLTRKREPVFTHLAGPVFWTLMQKMGMEGLYLSPTSGVGALWAPARLRVNRWEGMVQFAFTDEVGDDRDYGALLTSANKSRSFLGLEMTQAATGIGPDFFLGARGNPEYRRLYHMIEIPEQFWPELPVASEEWDCKALSAEQAETLRKADVLPPGADTPSSPDCRLLWGWAVTGKVLTGDNGKPRRFAYRWFLDPKRPILNWEDPQAGARRILSACAIRRIGTQGAALLGMQTLGFKGIEPGARPDGNPEPALSAAVAIAREVRRYGAWTWMEDELSLEQAQLFLQRGPDFLFDSVSSPGAEHALLTGNAQLLRFMYDESLRLGIDQSRLVRKLPDEHGLSYALPHLCLSPGGKKFPLSPNVVREQAKRRDGAWAGTTLYAGAAGLAALALDKNSEAAKAEIRRGQTLLLFFKAMQPGIFMLPARELVGALPLDGRQGRKYAPGENSALAMHGAYALLSTADDSLAGKSGLPRAAALYLPLDVQEMRPPEENFIRSVEEILRVRKLAGIAGGRFLGRLPTRHPGSIALLFALPGNQGALVVACNFSRTSCTESLQLGAAGAGTYLVGGVRRLWGAGGEGGSVSLGPWQGTALLIGKAPGRDTPMLPPPLPGKTGKPAAQRRQEQSAPASEPAAGERTHTIEAGDSLTKIAARGGVSLEALMRRNGFDRSSVIVIGRTLIIPVADAPPAASPFPSAPGNRE